MNGDTPQGIKRCFRGKKAREWQNIPPLLHPTLGHVFLKQQTFKRSLGRAEMEWKCYLDKKKPGLIEPLVSPSPNALSFFFFCLPPHPVSLTTLICFRLNLIRTRWIWLSFPASRLRNLASPPNHLSPPGFARLWHPTDFVTLRSLARRENYRARGSISSSKQWSKRLWEHKKWLTLFSTATFSLPSSTSLLAWLTFSLPLIASVAFSL